MRKTNVETQRFPILVPRKASTNIRNSASFPGVSREPNRRKKKRRKKKQTSIVAESSRPSGVSWELKSSGAAKTLEEEREGLRVLREEEEAFERRERDEGLSLWEMEELYVGSIGGNRAAEDEVIAIVVIVSERVSVGFLSEVYPKCLLRMPFWARLLELGIVGWAHSPNKIQRNC